MATKKLQIELDLPEELIEVFDQVAIALQEDRATVMRRALEYYAEQEGAVILDEAAGMAELDAGASFDLDDVLAETRAVIEAAAAQRAKRAG
ncbi:putative transcriptional regulator [Neorhizobium huautlense]|uniref:Transcriptional regulator n=1 Tax=Neorhizobium huautlense TaxID=67774 RepID=A0ABT9PME4_9HYPH|nr:ribbon-helix-helix protein, CopG family [Neorhizobium huautlense]MDP9835386.1 putative transcriptional regulator [Neorhizobium huautlense]